MVTLFSRYAVSVLFVLSVTACAVYDVDTVGNSTMRGSLTQAVNKDKARLVKEQNQQSTAPVYIDYSKRNPLLRHDEEFDANRRYENEDPFEEQVEFSDYRKLKQRQQQKRDMETRHRLSEDDEKPLSLW